MTSGGESDEALLEHMRQCIVRIQEYTRDGRDAFLSDEKTQDAVIRKLQTLAQSSIRLSNEAKSRESELPWARMRGFRNVVVHEYFDVNLSVVWDLVTDDLPPLLNAIERMKVRRGSGRGQETGN